MNTNELRIGNWIKLSEDGAICQVSGVRELAVMIRIARTSRGKMSEWVGIEHFSPILLTEEILLKCGAKKYAPNKMLSDRFDYDRFRLSYFPNYNYWRVTDKESNCYITKIEFLHEFQNTMFVLNGEEVEIKLE